MKKCKSLLAGDTIGIVATARKVVPEEIAYSKSVFRSWGLEIQEGPNLFEEMEQYAGTDDKRASDFQQMLDDPKIKAIICARGGYGTVRIIDKLDFTKFARNPKWIIGYSDISVIHSHIQRHYGIETLHATMPLNIVDDIETVDAIESLRSVLFGEEPEYEISDHPLNRNGRSEGILCGGNLSVLYSIIGSNSDIDTRGKILFLEDLDEYLYHIDRMMVNLKRNAKLDELAGLVVGGMTKMNDNSIPFGKTAEEIIREHCEEYDYPICFGFPAGHIKANLALVMGRKLVLSVGETVKLEFK